MSELVDKDAFLKQERKWYCENCDMRKGVKNGRKCFVYEIGEVPCRACAVDDVLDDLEDFPTASPWHRVEDELPSMDGYDWVLGVVTGEAGYHRFHKAIMTVSFDPEYKEWFIDEYPDAKITVSHWMELPEPPKEES